MSKKPLIYTAIAAGIFLVVSVPLGFIVGAFVMVFTGTVSETVGAGDPLVGIVAGVLTVLVYLAWGTYATYSYTSEKYGSGIGN